MADLVVMEPETVSPQGARAKFVPEWIVHPEVAPTRRVLMGVERNVSARPELFAERALSATHSYQETEGEPVAIRRAKMIRRILDEHPIVIQEGEVIVGMKAPKSRGSPVFPEINCAWVERDLDRLATRKDTPFFVSDEAKKILREAVFPYWRGRQIYDRLMEAVPTELWRADDRGVLYHYFRSRTIGHITAGYAKVLAKGMSGIRADVARAVESLRHEDAGYIHKKQFLESVDLVCEAVSSSHTGTPSMRDSSRSGSRTRSGVQRSFKPPLSATGYRLSPRARSRRHSNRSGSRTSC